MRAPATSIAAAVLCLLAGMGCAAVNNVDCPEGMDGFTEFNVYFGQETGDGETVTGEQWQTFLADTVTPRFPDGLTMIDAQGQWFDTENGRLYRESTKLLNVLVPVETSDANAIAVKEISDVYKQRFDQQAVFYTTLPACAEVY